MQALVYKSTGHHYIIKDDANKVWTARLRGKLKIDEEIKSSNPIAVGDIVDFEVEDVDTNTAIIYNIHKRENYIVRVSPKNRNQKHIIAANLDQAILVCTLATPRTSFGFIDRFIITAEAYHIRAVLVFNKMDLISEKEQADWEYMQQVYKKLGYAVYAVSATENEGLENIAALVQDKKSLLSGHSGVGKSTLLNRLIPNSQQKIQEISDWSGRGKHTTTFAEMMDLPNGGKLIDTPGIKEFGIIDIAKEELSHYFIEMRERLNDCKFNNCLHLEEPGCAIKEALFAGEISIDRYESYLSMLDSMEEKW